MNIVGITAEYNPFHKGHKYHIEKSVEATDADCTVVVMSGNFTQRGEAGIFDKWTRSRIAVEEGADLVVELPFVYACSIGKIFASGAVDILKGLGVTHISFGSENGKIDHLQDVVNGIETREDEIEELTAFYMNDGNSYARSYQIAVRDILGDNFAQIIGSPNNILAVEYLKRISYWNKKGADIKAVTVRRYGSGYNDENENSGFAGASVIRKMIGEGDESVKAYMPESICNLLTDMDKLKCQVNDVSQRSFMLLQSEIVKRTTESLARIYCMGEGLENKLKKEITRVKSLEELISSIVSKRYTEATIRRILTYLLVGLEESHPQNHIYGRILAAGPKGRQLIRKLKKSENCDLKIITNINKDIETDDGIWDVLKYDCISSDIYNIITGRPLYDFSDKVMRPYIKIG